MAPRSPTAYTSLAEVPQTRYSSSTPVGPIGSGASTHQLSEVHFLPVNRAVAAPGHEVVAILGLGAQLDARPGFEARAAGRRTVDARRHRGDAALAVEADRDGDRSGRPQIGATRVAGI